MHVTIVRPSSDKLAEQSWRFWVDGGRDNIRIHLDVYRESKRSTRRHKFRAVRYWSRLYDRESTIQRAAVPLPDDVLQEARQHIIDEMEFVQ